MDEKKGRKIASQYNIPMVGTLKILLMAKTKGLIDSLRKEVNELEKVNFRFIPKLKAELLKEAGEN